MKLRSLLLFIVFSSVSASVLFGATAVFNQVTGDWNVDAYWNTTGTVPGIGDTAAVRWVNTSGNMRTANISSAAPDVGAVTIGASGGRGTVNIFSGGSLTVIGATTVAGSEGADITNDAYLNISGGTFVGQGVTLGGASLGGSLQVSGGSATVSTLTVASAAGGVGNISVTGGSLAVTTSGYDLYLGGRVDGGVTTGSLILSSGTVRIGDASGNGRLMLGSSNGATQTIHSSATISGGVYTGRFLIGTGAGNGTGDGVLTIQGSAATIGSTSTDRGLELRSSGRIIFQLDATGISTLDYQNANVSFSNGGDLWIDGTSYTGGNQTFTLIRAASFTNGDLSYIDESITGFSESLYTTNLFFDIDNTLKLTVTAVPEPATLALLGLGFALVLLKVRPRAKIVQS